MKMVPFHNDGKTARHIGGKCIMPNSTREVEETLHPGFKPKPAAAPAPEISLIEQALKAVTADAIALMDQFGDDELAEWLETEEKASKPRKGVITAISAEQLARAQRKPEKPDADKFAAHLVGESDDYLAELVVLHADDADLLEIVNTEIATRAAENAE